MELWQIGVIVYILVGIGHALYCVWGSNDEDDIALGFFIILFWLLIDLVAFVSWVVGSFSNDSRHDQLH